VAALFVILARTLVAVACGDDDDDDGNGDNGGDDHTATGEVVATAGDIEIIDPYARETVNEVAAVYMTLQSVGLEDTLVSVRASVGSMWQIHETIEEGGSGRMQEVEGGLLIASGDHVHMQPGGYHVMLMGLTAPLEPGDEFDLELTFASGETASIAVPVRALDDDAEDQHDDDEHGDDHE
jgi:copper(I)-binding protein